MADRGDISRPTDGECLLQDSDVASAPPPIARVLLPPRLVSQPAERVLLGPRAERVLLGPRIMPQPDTRVMFAPRSVSQPAERALLAPRLVPQLAERMLLGPRVVPQPDMRALLEPHLDVRPARDDVLPGVDFEDDVFPSDCLHYTDTIPSQHLDSLTERSQLEVIIGEVYSPSHFWILRVGPNYNLAVEQIVDKMTAYYRGRGAGRVLARGALREGQYCASLFDHDWHRSLIVNIVDTDMIKVLHVDYGSVCTVTADALKPLRRVWATLPAQAVRARLAACRPSEGNWRWQRSASEWFLHRMQGTRFNAHLLAIDHQENIVETFLIDKTGAKDICITSELIHARHADLRTDSSLKSSDPYLYPRFSTLEYGATPNYAEICQIVADGIIIDYVESYRSHVPGPWHHPNRPLPAPAVLTRLSPQPLKLQNRDPLLRIDDRATEPRPPRPVRHNLMHSHSTPRPAPSPTLAYSPRPVLPSPAPTRPFGSPPERQAARSLQPLRNPHVMMPPSPTPATRAGEPARHHRPLSPMRYPLPPPGLGSGELRLSVEEWAVLSHRRGTNAANWYVLTQPWQDMLPPPPGL